MFVPREINPSSFVKLSKFFSKLLTLQFCIFAEKSTPDPGKVILISVLSFEYPTPPLTTVMDEIVPLLNTGVRTAPKPSPEITMSGGEL